MTRIYPKSVASEESWENDRASLQLANSSSSWFDRRKLALDDIPILGIIPDMESSSLMESHKLARHLRELREKKGLTLAEVAQASGLSRSTLSRIENAEVSPTAESLGRLAAVYALPISQLLSPLERGFQPVVKRDQQAVWRDPQHDFIRRIVSPANGQLSFELLECQLGQNQHIHYRAPAIPGQEHQIFVLAGRVEITVESVSHALEAGDCLRYILFGETTFRTGDAACKYLIALS